MIEIKGKYDTAIIYNDTVEETALSQISDILNNDISKNAHTRIMPDVHAGKGSVIGYTARLTDKVSPNIIGVDIGCGVLAINLKNIDIDFNKLDRVIRENVPFGNSTNKKPLIENVDKKIIEVAKKTNQDVDYVLNSIGSLGGGNHYIEIGEAYNKDKYLFIHSGSRNFGLKIANYHQNIAKNKKNENEHEEEKRYIIEKCKNENKKYLISEKLKELKNKYESVKSNGIEYLEGKEKEDYFYDMKVAQDYALLNRKIMADTILLHMFNTFSNEYETIQSTHNYINFQDNIIRKGAISAHEGKEIVIPMNMKFGHVIGIGKGNPEFNFSAPHGAGRIMSRSKAKEKISFEEFKETMKDIYSTSVKTSTIDEAPQAYKNPKEIIEYMADSVKVKEIIPPIYNFKA
jgi:tRNA-splicing ligase RtcB (3'-phosphate/5'-hydroxy nucleic acid ligase)